MTGLAAMREIETRRQRTFEYRTVRGDGDVPSVRLNEDFVLGRGHTSD